MENDEGKAGRYTLEFKQQAARLVESGQTCVRAAAPVYNWWSWCCHAAKPGARMGAITSRAPLLATECRGGKTRRRGHAPSET
jgi:hypothetical protein